MQYYVGEDDDRHMVDHPPLFACEWEGRKSLLRLNLSFVEELLSTAQDIMPGNPGEIAGVYFKPAEEIFTLHSFLIPPKIVLYNPDNHRGPAALPYLVVLIDKKFFGLPAIYLTPDRFEGCEGLASMKVRPRPKPAPRQAPAKPSQQQSLQQSGSRRVPAQQGPPSGQKPRPPNRRPPSGSKPPPQGPPRGRPASGSRPGPNRRPQRPRRPDESGTRGGGGEGRPRPRPK